MIDSRELEAATTPPSMNRNAIRSSWRGFHRAKKNWQQDLGMLLMAAGVPRPIPTAVPVACTVTLHFPDAGRRRDAENYRPLLSKALGDALVAGRHLADDTQDDWTLILRIAKDSAPAFRTHILLEWEVSS